VSDLAEAHERGVAAALSAVEVVPPCGYRWLSDTFQVSERIVRLADSEGRRNALIDVLLQRFYDSFFTAGRVRGARRAHPARAAHRELSHALAEANCGTGCLDRGWRFVARDGDRLVVASGGLRLWARRDEVDVEDDPLPGDFVAVRLPSDKPELSPGFYLALGDHSFSAEMPRLLDRFYFNLREEGAVEFVWHVTRILNGDGLAFRAKVVDEPGGFDRCDSALLMFERRDRARAVAAALRIQTALAAFLRSATPALTRPLAPGLAFAEDPGGGESFGISRCRLIATAVVIAHERGIRDPAGRLDVVRERFLAAGTSLEAPHLGADSPGDVEIAVTAGARIEEALSWR
jgi:class II lanthipeptide synthase